MKTTTLCGLAIALAGSWCSAAAQSAGGWQFGAVLDIAHTTRALELGGRDQGCLLYTSRCV